MTEIKKLSYKLEDIFALGKSLPVVAIRQLPKIIEQFRQLPDEQGYIPATQNAMACHVEKFQETMLPYIDDEKFLRKSFEVAYKNHRYGPDYLALYEED